MRGGVDRDSDGKKIGGKGRKVSPRESEAN